MTKGRLTWPTFVSIGGFRPFINFSSKGAVSPAIILTMTVAFICFMPSFAKDTDALSLA